MTEKTKTTCEIIGKTLGNLAVICIDALLIKIIFNFFAYNFNFATMTYGIALAIRFLNPFQMFKIEKSKDLKNNSNCDIIIK